MLTSSSRPSGRTLATLTVCASVLAACTGSTVRPGGPSASTKAATPDGGVTLQFSGDLGGQNACRDARRGYPIFNAILARPADAFIALGDMIYADGRCEARGPFDNAQVPGPTSTLSDAASFDERWAYNLADRGFRRLRRERPYYATWDDHEVVNDFGPGTAHTKDAPQDDLLDEGLAAFIRHNPTPDAPSDPTRLYRRLSFGDQAEVFLLDTRQYRDRNDRPDAAGTPKSMLGAAQRKWLINGLIASTAQWKFVASSVPMTIPTGWPETAPRDGWASGNGTDGFERELDAIFTALAEARVRNLVWLTADVHFATGFELRPLPAHPDFSTVEWVVGPLSAGVFPNDAMDPTFRPERLFMYAPDQPPASLDEALAWYNFGEATVADSGELTLRVVNGLGKTMAELKITPR